MLSITSLFFSVCFLSLENCVLNQAQDELKIIDFGMADRPPVVPGQVGKVNYMSPEVTQAFSYLLSVLFTLSVSLLRRS